MIRSGFQENRRCHAAWPGLQSGIALVLVLWVLSLLTIMALGLTMAQRSEHALTRNQVDAVRFRALAEAAVTLAVLNLSSDPLDAAAEDPWLPDGAPHQVSFGGEELEVRIFNQASRIDLNQITRDQLAVLLELAEAPAEQIDSLADAITDWRDPDQFVALNGAEDDTYRSEGYGYGAADQDFQSIDELQQVRGMTPELFRSLEPDLRVEAAQGSRAIRPSAGRSSARFDSQFASARALAVMQNITLEDAEILVADREESVVPDADAARPRARGGPEYRIRVTLQRGEAATRVLEVLVRSAGSLAGGFEQLWRREGILAKSDTEVTDDED